MSDDNITIEEFTFDPPVVTEEELEELYWKLAGSGMELRVHVYGLGTKICFSKPGEAKGSREFNYAINAIARSLNMQAEVISKLNGWVELETDKLIGLVDDGRKEEALGLRRAIMDAHRAYDVENADESQKTLELITTALEEALDYEDKDRTMVVVMKTMQLSEAFRLVSDTLRHMRGNGRQVAKAMDFAVSRQKANDLGAGIRELLMQSSGVS